MSYWRLTSACPTLSLVHVSAGCSSDGELRLEMKLIKGSGGTPKLSYTGRDDRHFVPTGIHIVRTVRGRH